MADFSHWDFTDAFTGREAAFLIKGADPSGPEADQHSVRHILERVQRAYHDAILYAEIEIFGAPLYPFATESDTAELLPSQHTLQSVQLRHALETWHAQRDLNEARRWFESGSSQGSNFHVQKFTRSELSRWLAAIGLKSFYKFDHQDPLRAQPAANEKSGDLPPNTNGRNSYLTIIAALCHCAGIDIQARGAAVQIAKLTEEIGARITDDTVRNILRQIPDALQSRQKE